MRGAMNLASGLTNKESFGRVEMMETSGENENIIPVLEKEMQDMIRCVFRHSEEKYLWSPDPQCSHASQKSQGAFESELLGAPM